MEYKVWNGKKMLHDFKLLRATPYDDENGKTIREGDVIDHEGFLYTVVYNEFEDYLRLKENITGREMRLDDGLKVLGNIYENPDLIKTEPEIGKPFYILNAYGDIEELIWNDSPSDHLIWDYGSGYLTRQEAEIADKTLTVETLMKKYSSDFVRGGDNYYLSYNYDYGYISMDNSRFKQHGLCFSSKEAANRMLVAVGVDDVMNYYLGVWL